MERIEPQERIRRYFNFNTDVPDSGNIPRDKAEVKLRFERALDEFFAWEPTPTTTHEELKRT